MNKILFFDDEPAVMGYLVQNLKNNYGWIGDKEIVFVSTIYDLFAELNSNREVYSLFVLDVMAPTPVVKLEKYFSQREWDDMDEGVNAGIVLANKIREMEKYKMVPILFLSARNITPISESEKGYTAYIRKPVSPKELSEKMNELLGIK